jgi:hypothetical protein
MQWPAVAELVERWLEQARDPALIRPRTPKFVKHKDDQALLTILLNDMAQAGQIELGDDEIDISSIRPVRWMSSRQRVPPWLPLWADPLARAAYRVYKMLDRWWLRLQAFEDLRVNGWKRGLRENFSVYLGVSGTDKSQLLECSWDSYLADPFLLRHQGRLYLLAEEFKFKTNRGRNVVLPIDESLRAGLPVPLKLPAGHVSFPFPFQHEGQVYLVPESCERRCVDLYVFDAFPHSLRRARRLLYGLNAADSVLFKHAGRYWLVTSVDEGDYKNRFLAIFSTADLLHGTFEPHPVNQRRLYVDRRFGYGRAAGAWLLTEGAMLRPIQASEHYYGEKLAWMKITCLDENGFEEEPYAPPPSLANVGTMPNSHHISADKTLWVCDTRDRVKLLHGVLWLLGRPWRQR